MSQQGSLASRLDVAIDAALTENRLIGAVVLVARDGETLYRRAAGFFDREAGQPMREDAIFRLSSVTKPLVAAATMRLVERGAIALDQSVTRWLPEFRPKLGDNSCPEITLHQLLSHTSGLSYRFLEPEGSAYHRLAVSDGIDQPGLALDDNLHRLIQAPLAFAPGSSWRYSLGFDVLGKVLETAVRKPLPEIIHDEVTGPLGMVDTGFAVADRSRLTAAYANGDEIPCRMDGDVAVPLWEGAVRFSPDRVLDPASYASGGAGMAGTATDILTFLEMIRTGGAPILKPDTVAAMMRDQVGPQAETQGPGWGFGYGWAVLVDPAAAATPQAKGTLQWGGVYGHNWFVDPANGLSIVILTNTAFEGMTGQLVTDVRDGVYG
ncbi:CubicO group peptidase (beta-lactamase class C family) [Agrobacterium vitis]|nr:CubicO group peptidase (beta-lactamase class C family) [Agrobacterium vitis]MBE1440235.1 CubicO group peptidase (beta-lactamase class C family) [Agrobacterium vitis]